MSQLHAKKVLQYKERFKKEAEELLLTGFPSTILKLNALIVTPKFKKRDFSDMHENLTSLSKSDLCVDLDLDKGDSVPQAKRPKYDDSACQTKVSCRLLQTNRFLIDLIETVKPPMIKLVEDAKIMKMWISYMIPKIEDGNNFGVEIQEETLALVHAVETCAALFYERISRYFCSRAKVIKNIIKYPDVEDYKRAVQELDEKEYVSFCLVMSDIRNHYCSLHDVFLKNLDKLKAPRTHHPTESLY
ncbi:proteasome activator complex subunit 3-like [Zophobas morio]|uniref:proteasome activator complex subunit 3-like n=1 Tax=Zophobas morio TaxID=2755281 RepID=UPI003083DC4B